MQPLNWEYRPDGLRAPALVCAFKGWNDAADAASTALTFVGSTLGAQRFATIDPEEFYDFQATRPQVKLVEGETRQIVWPATELYEARVPRAPRDMILMVGREPPPSTSVRSTSRCRAILTCRRSSSAWSRWRGLRSTMIRGPCPRGRRSPATFSASCASAATTPPGQASSAAAPPTSRRAPGP